MAKQVDLIGNHPGEEELLGIWLKALDTETSDTKCHRQLTEIISYRDDKLVDWMARTLINHHYSDFRLGRLKEKYKELGFDKYAELHRKLPVTDYVKKGNAAEVLLTEYIQSTVGKELIKVFKLKYNPNVDQAIKGDDTLMVDLFKKNGKDKIRLFLGESKFRKRPTKTEVKMISLSLAKDKVPLSYSFLVEEIAKEDEALALRLDDFIVEEVKDRGDLIYTGFLLSDSNASKVVEKNMESDNPTLIMISLGIDDPEDFVKVVFDRANEFIAKPESL